MRGRVTLKALVLLCGGSAAAADPPTICADRPGKATSACTVPGGHFQLETGLTDWTLQKAGGERDTSLVLGETTIKYGLTDASDIEIDVTPWQRATSRFRGVHESTSGIGDVTLVYKQRLTSVDAPVQIIAMPTVDAPTAKRSLGSGEWAGGLLIPIGYSIPNTRLAVALTPEIDWAADADGGGHHASLEQVASLSWAATDKLSVSGEVWGQWDWDPGGATRQASADGALAYLLSNRVQLDAGANIGLNGETPDIEVYIGYSQQF
jgi:hypothetical protein